MPVSYTHLDVYKRQVWDVGHQAYAHKILTGRKEQFQNLRKLGGISGFPNPHESEYDTFIAGHASNSISAALGMAIADSITPGREQLKTVAVIGDASISGGLAFEGLNNASNNPNNRRIILNDNDMSIDDNVGALHRYMTELTTSSRYNRFRDKIYRYFRDKGDVYKRQASHIALRKVSNEDDTHFYPLDGIRINTDPRGCLAIEIEGISLSLIHIYPVNWAKACSPTPDSSDDVIHHPIPRFPASSIHSTAPEKPPHRAGLSIM